MQCCSPADRQSLGSKGSMWGDLGAGEGGKVCASQYSELQEPYQLLFWRPSGL